MPRIPPEQAIPLEHMPAPVCGFVTRHVCIYACPTILNAHAHNTGLATLEGGLPVDPWGFLASGGLVQGPKIDEHSREAKSAWLLPEQPEINPPAEAPN